MNLSRLLILLLSVFVLLSGSACATKKYVRKSVDARVAPVEGRTSELEDISKELKARTGQLEETSAALRNDLNSLDQRATQGINEAKESARQANEQALAALNEAKDVGRQVESIDVWEEKQITTVTFRVNSAKLTQEGKAELDALAEQVKADKGYILEIRGFTDSTGSDAVNRRLSEMRAKAVFQYLAETHDIPLHRMTIVGLGESRPVADNKSRMGRAENRRVEVRLLTSVGLAGTQAGQRTPTSVNGIERQGAPSGVRSTQPTTTPGSTRRPDTPMSPQSPRTNINPTNQQQRPVTEPGEPKRPEDQQEKQ